MRFPQVNISPAEASVEMYRTIYDRMIVSVGGPHGRDFSLWLREMKEDDATWLGTPDSS